MENLHIDSDVENNTDFSLETLPLDEVLSMPCNCTLAVTEVMVLPILRKAGFSDRMTDKE